MNRLLFRSSVFRYGTLLLTMLTLVISVVLLINVNTHRTYANSRCSFGSACKVLAFLSGYGEEESDDNSDSGIVGYWFAPYYEYLCDIGMFNYDLSISENPDRPLMGSDLKEVFEYAGINVESEFNDETAILNTYFINLIADNKSKFNNGDKLVNIQLGIVAVSGEAESDSDVFDNPYTVSTNKGRYRYTGLNLSGYQDSTIEVFAIEDEILMITDVLAKSTTFKNVYISDFSENVLYVNMYGVNRTFVIGRTTEDVAGMLADITIQEGRIIGITIKKDITDTEVRILLYNSSAGSIEHTSVTFTSDETFYIQTGDTYAEYGAGTEVAIDKYDGLYKMSIISTDIRITIYESIVSDKITVTSSGSGQIRIMSVNKSQGTPEYEGKLDIYASESGIVLVNELPIESYLKRVVPSEMPSSYGLEALKAQAVCARSYAYAHLESYAYIEYEAHMDDTINFQVYNNTVEKEETNAAIAATSGKMLYYGDAIVSAFYYSTSCGSGTDVSLWGSNTADYPYYSARLISGDAKETDLSVESNFRKLITSSNESDYDYGSSYYRWSIEITSAQILDNLTASGFANVGSISSVTVNNRVTGGGVNSVVIKGDKGSVCLESEGVIRKIFELPSSFFVVDQGGKSGNLTFTFTGGGYGHGIGMSQNAAKNMAAQGMDYITILQFFYAGTSVF